jgi:hypothetical protein
MKKFAYRLLLVCGLCCLGTNAWAFEIGDTIAISYDVTSRNGTTTTYYLSESTSASNLGAVTDLDEYGLWVVGGSKGNYTFYNLGCHMYKDDANEGFHYLTHSGNSVQLSTYESAWQTSTSSSGAIRLSFEYTSRNRTRTYYLTCQGGSYYGYSWIASTSTSSVDLNVYKYVDYYLPSFTFYNKTNSVNTTSEYYKYDIGCNSESYDYTLKVSVRHIVRYTSESSTDIIDNSTDVEASKITINSMSSVMTGALKDSLASYTDNGTDGFNVTPRCHLQSAKSVTGTVTTALDFTFLDDDNNAINRKVSENLPFMQIAGTVTPIDTLVMTLTPTPYTFEKTGGTKTFTLSAKRYTGTSTMLSDGTELSSAITESDFDIDMDSYRSKDPARLLQAEATDFKVASIDAHTVTVEAPSAAEKVTDPCDTLQVYYQHTEGDSRFYYARAVIWQKSKYSGDSYTFTHQNGVTGRALENGMQGVHTQTKVVYLASGSSLSLALPESDYRGYMRVYNYDSDGTADNITTSYNYTELGNRGWCVTNLSAKLNAPTFTMPSGVASDSVIRIGIDVSNYTDFTQTSSSFIEPTLSYRVIYEIHPASVMGDKLSQCKGDKFLEEYNLIAPTNRTIMLNTAYDYKSSGSFPNYYYNATSRVSGYTWYKNGTKIDNITTGTSTAQVSSTTADTVVYTLVCSGFNIAKFTVAYQDENKVGPYTAGSYIISDSEMDKKYDLLTKLTFDSDESQYPKPSSSDYVALNTPLPWKECTYGFTYNNSSNPSNKRVAEHNNVSGPFAYWGEYMLVNKVPQGWYWKYAENVGGAENGYFIYCDGTSMSGKVVDLELKAQLCAGSQMFCSAYVNNLATGTSTLPSFEFVFVGIDDEGNEHQLTTFNTGLIEKRSDDGSSDKGWRQVFFAVSSDGNYPYYRLQIFNRANATSASDNDFAIDDIRIYTSRPPVLAYQASTTCGSTSANDSIISAVVRMDYNSLSGVDWQGKNIYYQWVKSYKDNNGVLQLDTLDIDYLNKDAAGKYGYLIFPADTANIPAGDRYSNIETFMDKRENDSTLTTCYILEETNGKTNYVMYVAHYAKMPAGYTYTLRMATSPQEMSNAVCGMSTELYVYGSAEIELNGKVESEALTSGVCGNQMYRLSIALFNNERDEDNNIALMKGHCNSDWLTGNPEAISADSCLKVYGYSYSEIEAAIRDLRAETYSYLNEYGTGYITIDQPNTWASSLDQINKDYLDKKDTYTIIEHLVNNDLLRLCKRYIDVYVSADSNAVMPEYTIFPIAGTGVNDSSSVEMGVCTTAKQISMKISGNQDTYKFVIGDKNEEVPAAIVNMPRGVRITQKEANTVIKLPLNVSNARADTIELAYTNDPAFVSSEKTHFRYSHNGNQANMPDTLILTPETGNAFSMRQGYTYTFEIHLVHPNGQSSTSGSSCPLGSSYFTFYVVPDTLVWSPRGTNDAWNNDDNWEMLNATKDAEGYVPLDASNIIIPDLGISGVYPTLPVNTEIGKKQKVAVEENAQDYITYDLNYKTHNCNYIHFGPRAQLANQFMLAYKGVWVEMPVPTQRWQMLSFPIKGVVSGDMYVPVNNYDNAGYFTSGDLCTDRAQYSFWQRLYNKSTDKVLNDGSTVKVTSATWGSTTNVVSFPYEVGAGAAFWCYDKLNTSVDELVVRLPKEDSEYSYYLYGQGYFNETISRAADAGKLAFEPTVGATDTVMSVTLTNNEAGKYFLVGNPAMSGLSLNHFFKENDDVFTGIYYTLSDAYNGDSITFDACSQHTTSGIDMVLAPFKAVLAETKNSETSITVKYTPEMFRTVADWEANFGVVANAPAAAPAQRGVRTRAARNNEDDDISLVTITGKFGNYYSTIYVGEWNEASDDVVAGEDAETISFSLNENTKMDQATEYLSFYAVADDKALTIDLLNKLNSVPLALHCVKKDYNPENFTLWFNGVSSFAQGLQLYDAQLKTTTRLIDGMKLTLESAPSDEPRYYLQRLGYSADGEGGKTTELDETGAEDITVFVQQGNVANIVADENLANVMIYNVAGQKIGEINDIFQRSTEVTLPQGVYLLNIATQTGTKVVRKVVIR